MAQIIINVYLECYWDVLFLHYLITVLLKLLNILPQQYLHMANFIMQFQNNTLRIQIKWI